MATNSGKGYRNGAVRERTQLQNQNSNIWYKRGPDGRERESRLGFRAAGYDVDSPETSNARRGRNYLRRG
jgi:hypothetical protein